ncbi:hypothetical protein JCM8208_002351 [Rhodotorula glutinis]
MPRASSTHGTASGASTPEPAASEAAASAALEPTSDLVSQPAAASTTAAAPAAAAAAVLDDDADDDDGLDPLTQLELGAFGTDAVDDALPAPPRDPNAASALAAGPGGAPANGAQGAAGGTAAVAGQGPGTKRTLAASGPLARAKRPKNVKFSPAKTGKALARRSAASAVVGDGGPGAYQLPNHDYCDACGGKGHFLCCEGGCLRSFHFSCLEPPLELDEVPEDSWYCKTCRAQVNPPLESRHRFFGELITRVETENPKEFSLPGEIKGFFKNVAVGTNGEYIDAVEHRPPSKITGRAIGQEDRDGFRLKDKNGRPIICYNCDGAANPQQRRRIISCDFCDQHWHLDCLDPPMTGMPPPTRKWMCPLHSDVVIPRKRQPKQTQLVNVDRPYHPNNGDIVVVPRPEPQLQQDVDEMTVNRVRYQVPEQHIILDFWGRVTGSKSQPQPPSKKFKGKSPRKRPASGYDSGDSSPLSDLTSSDESGSDVGRSSSRTAAASAAVAPVKADPSPLDNLALLAEVRYIDYLEQQQHQQQPVSNGTPVKAAASGGATPGRAHDLPPALPNSTQRRLPSRGLGAPPAGTTGPSTASSSSSSTAAAAAAKRPSFGGRPSVGGAPFASPAAGQTGSRSRGGSPSVSPAPGKLADVAVESKEDLKALGHVRRLVAAQSKLKEGDAKRAAMLDYLEGALIVPRLQSVGTGSSAAPWSRPWDDKPAGASAAGAAKKPAAAASGSQASPLGSPALAAAPAATGSASPAPVAAPAPSTSLPSGAPSSTTAAPPSSAPAVAASASTAPAGVAAASAPTPTTTSAAASSANGAATAASTLPASPLPFSLPASSSTSPRAAAAALAAVPVKQEDGDAGAGDAMDVDAPASAAAEGGVNGGA